MVIEKRYRPIILVILLMLFTSPMETKAVLEHIIIVDDIDSLNFTINENTGVFLDLNFTSPISNSLSDRIIDGGAQLILYLEKGENISSVTKFNIYPVDNRNRKINGKTGIIIEASTTPRAYVEFNLPLSIFGDYVDYDDRLGFIIYPVGKGEYTFHGTTHWYFEDEAAREKLPRLLLTYINVGEEEDVSIKRITAGYFEMSQEEAIRMNTILAAKNFQESQRKWYEEWYVVIPSMILGIIGGMWSIYEMFFFFKNRKK